MITTVSNETELPRLIKKFKIAAEKADFSKYKGYGRTLKDGTIHRAMPFIPIPQKRCNHFLKIQN